MNTTTLLTAAQGLATTLQTAATNMGWSPEVCVTPIEPAFDCERIHVWFASIDQEYAGRCQIVSKVQFRWAVASCIGSDKKEPCAWWDEAGRTDDALKRLWGIYGGLVLAFFDGTLCTNMGVSGCEKVVVGRVDRMDSVDLVVYSGIVTVTLDVS